MNSVSTLVSEVTIFIGIFGLLLDLDETLECEQQTGNPHDRYAEHDQTRLDCRLNTVEYQTF